MGLIGAKASIDVGIFVSDFEASLRFYVEFLGLEYVDDIIVPFGPMKRLRYGESLVKLIRSVEPIHEGPRELMEVLGIRYLTFDVTNFEEILHLAVTKKIPIEIGPTRLSQSLSMAMLRDPDGNIVEIIQRHEST